MQNLVTMRFEMVYGTGIRLPAEFFLTATQLVNLEYANQVKKQIKKITPQLIVQYGTKKIFISRELASSPYIFLRNDAVRHPLQPPYDGPYKVIPEIKIL